MLSIIIIIIIIIISGDRQTDTQNDYSGNNLSGFASQFATQNIHSRDANLAPSAKNRDTFLRTRTCPGGNTGGRQLDYARSLFSGCVSCTPSRL